MMVAYVLRLRSEALARGAVVGELEDVDTGTRHVLRSADELLAFLAAPRTALDDVAAAGPDDPAGAPVDLPP